MVSTNQKACVVKKSKVTRRDRVTEGAEEGEGGKLTAGLCAELPRQGGQLCLLEHEWLAARRVGAQSDRSIWAEKGGRAVRRRRGNAVSVAGGVQTAAGGIARG
jgi:hypothetical protein